MNKLTTLRAAFSPHIFWHAPRLRRYCPVAPVAVPRSAPAHHAPHGLICTWTQDPATGRLHCAWSAAEPEPLSSNRHSSRRPPRRQKRVLARPRLRNAA